MDSLLNFDGDLPSISSEGSVGSSLEPDLGQLSSELDIPQASELQGMAEDTAWQVRENAQARVSRLPADAQGTAREAIDAAVEAAFPGLIAARTAPAATAAENATDSTVDTGSCPKEARACVDLEGGRSWLQENGEVTYGPVASSGGGDTAETATPKGTFYVTRKVREEISHEFGDAPMPYSVYFTDTGVAFHEGEVGVPSAGCIHLSGPDAEEFFNELQVGDMVYVY